MLLPSRRLEYFMADTSSIRGDGVFFHEGMMREFLAFVAAGLLVAGWITGTRSSVGPTFDPNGAMHGANAQVVSPSLDPNG